MSVRRLSLLYTGGTLGMQPGPQGLEAAPQFDRQLLEALPCNWLDDQGIAIDYQELSPPLDSSAMQPAHWFQLAAWAKEAQAKHQGLVILQGTDTLCWTASALFWLLPGLRCPLILTGAQKPLQLPGSDALGNVQEALLWASQPQSQGVYLSFNRKIFDPRRVRKFSSQARDAFISCDAGPLAFFEPPSLPPLYQIHPLPELPQLSQAQLEQLASDFQPRILRLPLIPGLSASELAQLLPNWDALILEGLGSGNTPPLSAFFKALEASRQPVGLVSQCWAGGVGCDYAASASIHAAGVVPLAQSTPESAQTALTWLLALQASFGLSLEAVKNAWKKTG